MLFHEFPDRIGLVYSKDLLVGLVVLIPIAHGKDAGVRRFFGFDQDGILLRIQAGRDGVVGVDAGHIGIIQAAGDLGRIDFDELEIFRVLHDISHGSFNGISVLQFDQARLLDQEERPGTVGRIVRDGHFGAVRHILQILDLMGVHSHRHQDGLADGFQLHALFLDHVVEVGLMLIGIGGLMDEAKAKVEKLGLTDSVLFLGARNDVNRLYQAMDTFAFPSRYEGLGLVAVEAQCAGLPVVASTAVPMEARVSDNIEFVALDNMAEWVTAIKASRKSNRYIQIDSRFDIHLESKKLQNAYDRWLSETANKQKRG